LATSAGYISKRWEKMVTDIFIDGASSGVIQNGVVRINLTTLSATERDENGRATREVRHRLLMTTSAATELHAFLETALRRMAEAGVVKRRDDSSETLEEETLEPEQESAGA